MMVYELPYDRSYVNQNSRTVHPGLSQTPVTLPAGYPTIRTSTHAGNSRAINPLLGARQACLHPGQSSCLSVGPNRERGPKHPQSFQQDNLHESMASSCGQTLGTGKRCWSAATQLHCVSSSTTRVGHSRPQANPRGFTIFLCMNFCCVHYCCCRCRPEDCVGSPRTGWQCLCFVLDFRCSKHLGRRLQTIRPSGCTSLLG